MNKWHYDVIKQFHDDYYNGLITTNMISSNEIHITEAKGMRGTIEELDEEFFYIAKKNKVKYLIPSDFVDKKLLPLDIQESKKVSFRNNGYRYPEAIQPMTIRPIKKMEFKELLDEFVDDKHTNPEDDALWKLLALVSYVDRINIRVATPPSFGKDSKMRVLSYLLGNVGIISNATKAKMEYLLFNDVIMLNELSHLSSENKKGVEQFILSMGDYSVKYTKSSRSNKGTSESYDTPDLSLVIAYNTIDNYQNENKYFDCMWQNSGAVNDRFIPFKLDGKLLEEFESPYNTRKIAKDNRDYFLDIMRTILWYKKNSNQKEMEYKFPDFMDKLKGRWKRTMKTILFYLSLCCDSQQELDIKARKLYDKHIDYLKMVGFETDKTPLVEEEIVGEERDIEQVVVDYMKNKDKEDIEELKHHCKIDDKELNTLILNGVIFKPQSGKVKLL